MLGLLKTMYHILYFIISTSVGMLSFFIKNFLYSVRTFLMSLLRYSILDYACILCYHLLPSCIEIYNYVPKFLGTCIKKKKMNPL